MVGAERCPVHSSWTRASAAARTPGGRGEGPTYWWEDRGSGEVIARACLLPAVCQAPF